MTHKIKLLKELLDYVDRFESQGDSVDLKKFSLYLSEQLFERKKTNSDENYKKADYPEYKNYKEVEFSTLLTGLFRFAKHYLKKTFQNRSFKTIDEFGFLANLLKDNSMLKNELINQHQLEMSTGSEVLKRMVKNGLIKEVQDKDDKRAKRVMLTDKGKEDIIDAFDEMYIVSKVIRGNISDEELNNVILILNKLTYFHKEIWSLDKTSKMETIYKKYIEEK